MAMAVATTRQNPALGLFQRHRGLIVAVGIAALPIVIIRPLPTWLMDFLLTFNITVAVVILLTTLYVNRPLDFSVFPSLLLVATLYRLVLNVATTRLILSNAGVMRGDAAGGVIRTFGEFVAGNDPVIGLIIFVILVVIQFIVITRGATRISEVAARFTLDAMPGKQMSIDADLNAGLITEVEARDRRSQISREADFYGAMDGASKFVRGDAIAGIIIVIIDIIGGFVIGVTKYGFTIGESANIFTKLTVGDGLVTQIPAFVISISAGLIVTRSTAEHHLGEELLRQVFSQPVALMIGAGFLFALVFTPLPTIPLAVLGVGLGGVAYTMLRSRAEAEHARERREKERAPREPERVEPLLRVDLMEVEVGYGLVRLVDTAQGGDLLERVTMIRRQIATELGVIVPPIRIRDNMQLDPNQYRVKIRGVEVADGKVYPDQFLAMDAGVATGKLEGEQTTEPAFGLPAVWITAAQKNRGEVMGYTVVEPTSVVATHLSEIIKSNAADLLTREQVSQLLDNLRQTASALVDEVIPDIMRPGEVHRVLQNLLRERVSIRDLEIILETLSNYATKTKDIDVLTEYVRNAVSRSISQQYQEPDGKLYVITIDPALEDIISRSVERTERGTFVKLAPDLVQRIVQAISREGERLLGSGHQPIVLCSPNVRAYVRRLTESLMPGLVVLSYNEVARGVQVESLGMAALEE
jgi:flagellar biosynthesis protein FlhA